MSERGRYRAKQNRHIRFGAKPATQQKISEVTEESPVLNMFKMTALKLNDRQDRYERLVKMSRDITIESKRIIFLLHSAITKDSLEKVTKEASERLQKLIEGPMKCIGLELEDCPAHLYSRAVTVGLQEFIEARTMCSLLESKQIITYAKAQDELRFTRSDEDNVGYLAKLPHTDYMLGIADLTGELMRRAINSISSGESEECFYICQVMRDLYTGFLGLFNPGRELSRKWSTTHHNMLKIEAAVYALHVRGEEAPPSLLVPTPVPIDSDLTHQQSDDEGYY